MIILVSLLFKTTVWFLSTVKLHISIYACNYTITLPPVFTLQCLTGKADKNKSKHDQKVVHISSNLVWVSCTFTKLFRDWHRKNTSVWFRALLNYIIGCFQSVIFSSLLKIVRYLFHADSHVPHSTKYLRDKFFVVKSPRWHSQKNFRDVMPFHHIRLYSRQFTKKNFWDRVIGNKPKSCTSCVLWIFFIGLDSSQTLLTSEGLYCLQL